MPEQQRGPGKQYNLSKNTLKETKRWETSRSPTNTSIPYRN